MPFKRGVAPIRRTVKYLESGPIAFKERVKVLTVNYNEYQKFKTSRADFSNHEGAKEFVFWTLPQIQYKHPNLQIATFKNMTPSPFITCYLEDGQKVLFDVDGQSKEKIIERLAKTLGKSDKTLAEEALASAQRHNPANFGKNCGRHCICSEPGQVPCPMFVPLPKHWRGKYHYGLVEDAEEEQAEN